MQIDADDFIKVMEEERRNHPVKMNKGLAIECIETQRQFVDKLTCEAFDMAIKALEQPERKNGNWSDSCCSVCGVSRYNFIKMLHIDDGYCGTWKFCPNCGADMRGDDHGTD